MFLCQNFIDSSPRDRDRGYGAKVGTDAFAEDASEDEEDADEDEESDEDGCDREGPQTHADFMSTFLSLYEDPSGDGKAPSSDGADPFAVNTFGETAFMIAQSRGPGALRALVKAVKENKKYYTKLMQFKKEVRTRRSNSPTNGEEAKQKESSDSTKDVAAKRGSCAVCAIM